MGGKDERGLKLSPKSSVEAHLRQISVTDNIAPDSSRCFIAREVC